ncbi:MAG: c-type cytochrome [Verrucomicrobiales bacterium]|nr:c-type cytochrome [Verrucomicrobiales bacterium]
MIRLLALTTLLSTAALSAAADSAFPEPFDTEPGNPQPMPAEEAARSMKLPPGFRCQLVASEPMVRQPIAIDFDSKGRLWVAECYTYAQQPLRWEMKLRDRLLILEDPDGDGQADHAKVFWDEGQRLTSVATAPGGVYALCPPQLIFLPDADGDDRPDGPPQVLLDGFDAETIGHNIVNGLKFGPDGWLYGRHGITSTSAVGAPGTPESERTRFNCAIWRFHPTQHRFEVFCHGGTNPWGSDWNASGQLFYTNTVIGHLWHAIPGAYYERMFGSHLRSGIYEIINHTADHVHWDSGAEVWNDIRKGVSSRTSELGGGHAHMGCLIYPGGNWPQDYVGKLFTCNLHGNRINMDILEREGCGYTAHHGADFMQAADPWFRGLDLVTAPDGSVYVNDWSDTGECHDNDGIHRNSGRIYRIIYEGENPSTRQDPPLAAFSAKKRADTLTTSDLEAMRHHADEGVRAMGARWSVDAAPENSAEILQAAAADSSGLVRLETAAALQRIPAAQRFPLASRLASVTADATDRQQPLMIWYAIEPLIADHPTEALALIRDTSMPTLRRLISRRLTETIDTAPEPVAQLVTLAAETPPAQTAILTGMAEGLRGWTRATAPTSWPALAKKLAQTQETDLQTALRELTQVFGDGRNRQELLAISRDAEADPDARRQAAANLLRDPQPDLLPVLKDWLKDKIMARTAILGLAHFDDVESAHTMANLWSRRLEDREAIIATLVSRPSSARALLQHIERGTLPRTALSPFNARQILAMKDPNLDTLLRRIWGEVRETAADRQQQLQQWRERLQPDQISSADASKGRLLFVQACSACHRLYGEGGQIGPELTGSDRHNLDYLLGNIIDPSSVVPADYRTTVFHLKDGRTLTGVVPERTERTTTVQTPTERLTLENSQITQQEQLPVSLMPDQLLELLGEENARHLFAYLMSRAQVPLPVAE